MPHPVVVGMQALRKPIVSHGSCLFALGWPPLTSAGYIICFPSLLSTWQQCGRFQGFCSFESPSEPYL